MSGIRSSNHADAALQELVREESTRERVGQIQPDTYNYEGMGSQTEIRQSGASNQNIRTSNQSGYRVQSPTLSNRNSQLRNSNQSGLRVQSPPLEGQAPLKPNSPTIIEEGRVQSPQLGGSTQWRESKVSRESSGVLDENKRIKQLGMAQNNSGNFIQMNQQRLATRSNVRSGDSRNHLVRERNERFVTDHTVNKESKIEYVPFERKIIQYEERERRETVPKKKIITDYEEQVRYEMVPRVVTKEDYYAIQYIKEYVAEQIPQKTINYVQKRVPYKRIQYVPVTRQVVHYNGQNNQQAMNMNGCSQGFPVMQANFQNQSYGPSFYQNYSGHFFNPTSQPVPSSQPWVNPSANMPGMRTEGYNQGLSELSKYSKTTCNGYKLNKHYNLYDHYETYIPSFQY